MKTAGSGPWNVLRLALRRATTRYFGPGPSGRIEPFGWHLRHQHPGRRCSLSQRERFTGLLHAEPGESFAFAPFRIIAADGQIHFPTTTQPPTVLAGIAPGPAARIFSLCPGAVAGTGCVVYCPETRVAVEESIRLWDQPIRRHPLFAAPRFPPATLLPGVGLVVGVLSVDSFYHFLLESLPKLALCRRWWNAIDHFIVNGQPGGHAEKWLVHAGVPAAKLRWLGDFGHYLCDQLIFTSQLAAHHFATESALRQLHSLWPRGQPGVATRRLWISRRGAVTRDLAWEDVLLRQLPGFESVSLQTLAPAEQIELFRTARTIAGPHGAGLAGMIFAPPGTQVLEFCNVAEAGANTFYSRLAQVAGLDHLAVQVDFRTESDVRWLRPHLA